MITEAIPSKEVHNAVVVTTPDAKAPIQFNVSASAIVRIQKEASKLSIAGPDDKDGYKALNEFRLTVTRQLADVRRKQKELKRPHTDYNRDVDAAANALIDPMVDVENTLKLAEKKYNDDIARIAREKELAQQMRTEGRVNQLRGLGFTYSSIDGTYDFHHGPEAEYVLEINFDDIKNLSDEDYASTLRLAETTSKAEADRLAEVKRLADQEAKRIADEQKAERKRLAAEKKRLDDDRAEMNRKLKEQDDKLKEQAKQIEAQNLRSRTEALLAVGCTKNPIEDDGVDLPGGHMYLTDAEILDYTDEKFLSLIEKIIADNEQRKQKQIDDEAAEAKRIENEAEADRLKKLADDARTERLSPDKKLLFAYLNKLATLTMPKIKQPESEQFFGEFCNDVDRVINSYKRKLEEL